MFICICGQDRTGHNILPDTNDIIIPFLFFLFFSSLRYMLYSHPSPSFVSEVRNKVVERGLAWGCRVGNTWLAHVRVSKS